MKQPKPEQKMIDDIVLRIDRLRCECGYSIYELSQKANLSVNTLKHIYKRQSFPNISTLWRLCIAFHLSIWQFFFFTETDVLFTEKEIALLEHFEKLTPYSKFLLFELSKWLK